MVEPAIKEVSFLPLQVEKFAGGESKERQGKRVATWESGIWEGTSFVKIRVQRTRLWANP